MISLKEVEAKIKDKISNATVIVRDLGGGDHLEAIVVSSDFEGQSKVKQHQLVYSALQQEMATETIHALALKTYTPQAWQDATQSV